MSKANPIEPAEIPPHMLEEPRNRAQKKAFAKAKRAEKREKPAAKKAAKRSGVKRTASAESEGGYGTGAGKDEKP